MDQCPTDENGNYLQIISFRNSPEQFLSMLEELLTERLSACRTQMEIMQDCVGIKAPPGIMKASETGARLFAMIDEGINRARNGAGNTIIPDNMAWNLNALMKLVCGDYTFDTGFYDAVIRYNGIIPTEQDIRNSIEQTGEDHDLYLVPLDIHY